MVVGDSYAEGCCLQDRNYSFAGLLAQNAGVRVYNFAILGTDPLQYRLVLENYVEKVQPDLILSFIYLGNDLMPYPREPRPGKPIGFNVAGYGVMLYEIPFGDSIYRFDSPEESYTWYLENLTLLGPERSWWNRTFGKSALYTHLYYALEVESKLSPYDPWKNKSPYTSNEISKMVKIAEADAIPIMLMGIPSPEDVLNQVNLKEEYQFVFGEYEWNYPDISTFWEGDFDGISRSNHFNRFGHV
ncbi:MAG: hypothetical protein AAF570_16500, partial [Bacteroidota bacterium]